MYNAPYQDKCIGSRHCSRDSKRSTYFKVDLLANIIVPLKCSRFLWMSPSLTVGIPWKLEGMIQYTCRTTCSTCSDKCTSLKETSTTTTTLNTAIRDALNAHCHFAPPLGPNPKGFEPHQNLAKTAFAV